MSNAESQKWLAKGSNSKEDDMAFPLYSIDVLLLYNVFHVELQFQCLNTFNLKALW